MKFTLILLKIFVCLLLVVATACDEENRTQELKPDITGDHGTLTDFDGNIYNWIGIGQQAWMAENLRVTHFPNGELINLSTGANQGSCDHFGDNYLNEFSFYNDNQQSPYGALYSWTAAMGGDDYRDFLDQTVVQGVCPDGWHLPSVLEWEQLKDYLREKGFSSMEAHTLKSKMGWSNNRNGTDKIGFNGYPSGVAFWGTYRDSSEATMWWCSNKNIEPTSITPCFGLKVDSLSLLQLGAYKDYGLSVRCVRD